MYGSLRSALQPLDIIRLGGVQLTLASYDLAQLGFCSILIEFSEPESAENNSWGYLHGGFQRAAPRDFLPDKAPVHANPLEHSAPKVAA
jgi:hypothetical protein